MEMTYRILSEEELHLMYACLQAEDILWALFPEDRRTEEAFVADLMQDTVLPLGGFIDGVMAGMLIVRPFNMGSKCAEIGVTALRRFFPYASDLCRGALLWTFDHLDCTSMIGKVPVASRHIVRMLSDVGFKSVCRIPDMVYYLRKHDYSDGLLVFATPDSVRASKEA